MFCSPSLLNSLLHFTAAVWFWSAAPRPGPGFSSLAPINPPNQITPGSRMQCTAPQGQQISGSGRCPGASTNPLGLSTGHPPSPGWEGATAGAGAPNFSPPLRAHEKSVLDPGPAGIKWQTRLQFAPSQKGRQTERAGRKCPQPKCSYLFPLPPPSKLTSPRPQLAAHFSNSRFSKWPRGADGAQKVLEEGVKGGRGQQLLHTATSHSSALSSPVSEPPPLGPPPPGPAQRGAREAA